MISMAMESKTINLTEVPPHDTIFIYEVCQAARFRPPIICTPIEIIEETQMREKVDTGMDAVLEECYQMKEEFNAQFKSMKELSDYLRAENKKRKALGWKYVSVPKPQDDCYQKN